MMFSRSLFALAALLSATAVSAAPSKRAALDIFDPPVLTPNAQVGWVIGTQANVTWDTSNAPEDISNASLVALAKGGITLASGPGSPSEPLAQGFDLRTGFVTITVPDITPASDYQVILFGDSGNLGPDFSITEPSS